MNTWPVQDAKARFSELLDACLAEGSQRGTHRGVEVAVLVSAAEWKRLQSAAPSRKELLLSDAARTEFLVSPRGSAHRRQVTALG